MTTQPERITGRELNTKWQVGAKHALYRADGKWYHLVNDFPAALFDASGYVLFESEEDYQSCRYLMIGKHLHVPDGIAAIPGYIQVVYDESKQQGLKEQHEQYSEFTSTDETLPDSKRPRQFFFTDQHGARAPNEIISSEQLSEGAIRTVQVNAYERNTAARALCIKHHGCKCSVCGFNFEQTYGLIGRDFIHVHHLVPLSKIGKEYQVDPIHDLIPVCPNCHAMLHRNDPPLTIEELRRYIQQQL